MYILLGNKVGGVGVSSLEDFSELLIHPLHKHKDVTMDLVGLVRRLERERERERERMSESAQL